MGAHLMEIRLHEELDRAIQYSSTYPLWIGGSDIQEEGNWVWNSNQEEVNLNEFWYDNGPYYDIDTNCLAVFRGAFIDNRCSSVGIFACEFN